MNLVINKVEKLKLLHIVPKNYILFDLDNVKFQ
jgi:hypothetical protein